MNLPYSDDTNATYENFEAVCPLCRDTNIFNRASDLKTFKPIGFRTVSCQACGGSFNINGDSANVAHEMLLFDCFEFMKRKRYIHCVLSVAQAYEAFFNHFLRVQLIYRAFAREGSSDLSHLNRVLTQLYERTKQLTFEPMRRLVLRLLVDNEAPESLAQSEAIIANFPRKPPIVPEQNLRSADDVPLRDLLLRLHATEINKLRNKVIHKQAYRPTVEEAKHVHEEATEILHGLAGYFCMLGDDINWYISGEGSLGESRR
ncbi:MAG: hypothetical protein ABSA52_19540 [Candidatus Binatia bacterium]|jgi:hypothetical protein